MSLGRPLSRRWLRWLPNLSAFLRVKRSRSMAPNLPVKRPREAKMARSGKGTAVSHSVKSAGESLQSTGLVRSTKPSRFGKTSRIPARSSRPDRLDETKATSGSARTSSTERIVGNTRSASKTGNKRTQKLPVSNLSLFNTEPSTFPKRIHWLADLDSAHRCGAVTRRGVFRLVQDSLLLQSS